MKRLNVLLCTITLALTFLASQNLFATSISLNVDTAPNIYGSSDWAPWWADAKTDVVEGSFTNMRSGHFPGTLYADPYDEIVYSTGDLGHRLHWIYWLSDETIDHLDDGLFEVKWVIDWDGSDWTYDGGAWAADGAEVGWAQPTKWEDYDDGTNTGVIGSLGFAWWSTDNDAPPFDTGGSLYDETDQADIDALRAEVLQAQTHATGYLRYRPDTSSDWQTMSLKVEIKSIPDATTLALFGSAMIIGALFIRRRRFQL